MYTDKETPAAEDLVEHPAFQTLVARASEWADGSMYPPADFALFGPACAAGLKPGLTCSFRGVTDAEVSDMLHELGFSYKLAIDDRDGVIIVHASPDKNRAQNVQMFVEDATYGRFLGVPEADLEWYDEPNMPSIPEATPLTEHLDMDVSEWPAIRRARISPWVCRPTENGVERTIEICNAWYALAERLADNGYAKALEYAEDECRRENHPWFPS